MTVLFVSLFIAVVAVPVGATAAQLLNVTITDPEGTNQASVDTDGDLHVEVGNTSLPVQFQGTGRFEHVPAEPFRMKGIIGLEVGESFDGTKVQVPAGKMFVAEHVAAIVNVPPGQKAEISIGVTEANKLYVYTPILHYQVTTSFSSSPDDLLHANEEITIYAGAAGPAEVEFGCIRMDPGSSSPSGFAICDILLTGYLVDA
jgi:hypothetical protein